MSRACVVCACAVLICAPVWAQVTYQVDDGTIENAVGLTAGGDSWWANGFTAVAGAEGIGEIQIAFASGEVTAGQAFSVHVYEDSDDDGDPTTGTLTLLASANATVADASGETFQSIAIGPATVSGGFFVAAVMTHTGGQYPAAGDTDSTYQAQSWIGGTNTAGGMDPADPLTTSDVIAVQRIDGLTYEWNWTLRAVGNEGDGEASAIPALGTAGASLMILLLAGSAGVLLRRRLG